MPPVENVWWFDFLSLTPFSSEMWDQQSNHKNSVYQSSVLLRTKLQQPYLWTSSSSLRFCVRDVASCFSLRLTTEMGSLLLLSQVTDAWWLGNVADCLKVRLHNSSSSKQRTGLIIAFLAHAWQVFKTRNFTRHSPPWCGQLNTRLETRLKRFQDKVFSFSLTLVSYKS